MKTLTELEQSSPVARTLLIPLFWRANESRHPNGWLHDPKAIEIYDRLGLDWKQFPGQEHDQVATALRTRAIDRIAVRYLEEHPRAVVIDVGCGLDTHFYCCDNGQVRWLDLDLPEVITLRRSLMEETDRHCFLSGSAFDLSWMQNLPIEPGEPCLILSEGVFCYFHEAEVKKLVLALLSRFPGCEFVFDALPRWVIKPDNLQLILMKQKARLHWGVGDDRELETWHPSIRWLESDAYMNVNEPRLGPLNQMMKIDFFRRSFRILHYRLGS